MLGRFRDFLSAATPAQRCIVALLISQPSLLAFMSAPLWGVIYPRLTRVMNTSAVVAGTEALGAVIVPCLLMLAWLWPRRHNPQPLPWVYRILAILITTGFAIPAILGGNLTYPTNLVIICLVPCGLMVLDMKSTATGVALGIIFIWLNDVANFTGKIAYAPAYTPLAFTGTHQYVAAELIRSGILYCSVAIYGTLLWLLFDQYDDRQLKLTQLSRLDMLTQLANRRHFMERLEQECQKQARTNRPISLAMIDADHFKQINDTHGHPAGDQVLEQLARMLEQQMRVPSDLPARLGGEEFAILFPETTLAGAKSVCNRIMASLARIQFEGKDGPFTLTLSIGLVESSHLNGEALWHHADSNLYQAKTRGRNQVVATRPEPSQSPIEPTLSRTGI